MKKTLEKNAIMIITYSCLSITCINIDFHTLTYLSVSHFLNLISCHQCHFWFCHTYRTLHRTVNVYALVLFQQHEWDVKHFWMYVWYEKCYINMVLLYYAHDYYIIHVSATMWTPFS